MLAEYNSIPGACQTGSLLVAFVSWAFHGTPDFASRRRYIKAGLEQKKFSSSARIKHTARTDLHSTKGSLDIYLANKSHSVSRMPVTSLNGHPMNQADGLLPLTARNLSNLADMGASYSGDELPPATASGKAATDCEDSLPARELDNVDRGVAGRPHDTMDDSTLPPENRASSGGTTMGAEADSKAPRRLEDYAYGTIDQGMGDDADGGFDHLAKKAEKDFGEDPVHEFWSWDKGEQSWVHEDEKTGVKIYAPEELD